MRLLPHVARLRFHATYWYRRARGRCVVCGGLRVRRGGWMFPYRYACSWCNKRVQHGMNYGMGAKFLYPTPPVQPPVARVH